MSWPRALTHKHAQGACVKFRMGVREKIGMGAKGRATCAITFGFMHNVASHAQCSLTCTLFGGCGPMCRTCRKVWQVSQSVATSF